MEPVRPRPVPLYFASEVVAFIQAVDVVDVSPYMKMLFHADGVA